MNIARKALAVAAVAGLGMTGFAATAQAAPNTPRPNNATVKAAGDWAVAVTEGDIQPRTVMIQAGSKYTVTGTINAKGEQATGAWTVTFNTAPGNGNIACSATATNGGVVNGGTISWSNVSLGTASANYTITCTYKTAYKPVVNEKIVLTAKGHVYESATKLVDTQTIDYSIGGTLPSSATPTPTTSKAPVKDKDSKGGLAKTGF